MSMLQREFEKLDLYTGEVFSVKAKDKFRSLPEINASIL